jgi:endonuclease/exonuclease/phosphatase family metal-dependent hydrolase
MPIKIITFNIEGFTSNRGYQFAWKHRAAVNIHIIKKYIPDIICLQEAEEENIECYTKNFPYYETLKGLPVFLQNKKRVTYTPILWNKNRFSNERHGSFYLSKTPYKYSKSWRAKYIRTVNWIKLLDKKSKTNFFVINTHLDNYSEQARIKSSELINTKINSLLSQEELPVILAGDFNSRPWAPYDENNSIYSAPIIPHALPPAEKVYNTYLNNRFTDTYFYVFKNNVLNMNTYHDYYGTKFPPAGLRIDWILKRDYKEIFTGLNYLIIKDSLNSVYPSDHYPVLVELEENKIHTICKY